MMRYKEGNYYIRYSELSLEKRLIYYNEIRNFVKRIAWEYNGFWSWYDKLFLPNLELDRTREIIICQSEFQMAGIAILKKDIDEQKICTLRVAKAFQRRGIGKELMELSMEWLQSDKPLITVHKSRNNEFRSLFSYYGFVLEEQQKHYYHLFNTELVYNGTLPEKEIFLSSEELIDLGDIVKGFLNSGQKNFNIFLDSCIQQWWGQEQLREQIIKGY